MPPGVRIMLVSTTANWLYLVEGEFLFLNKGLGSCRLYLHYKMYASCLSPPLPTYLLPQRKKCRNPQGHFQETNVTES